MAFSADDGDNGSVLTVTEPQVWTMIGLFAAIVIGMLTVVSTLFVHIVRSEAGRIDAKADAGFAALDRRFDALDRDVQALMRHTFGIDRN